MTLPSYKGKILDAFHTRFGSKVGFLVRAPGRVNLIGEHTDYNDGFVLPMAIDRAIWVGLRKRGDKKVIVHSLDFDQTQEFSLDEVKEKKQNVSVSHRGNIVWIEYLKGIAWALQDAKYGLRGWEGVVGGDVPKGAGLSSSAALEMATIRAFESVSDFHWNPVEMAKIAQKSENQWVGVNCGIMDQLISAAGHADHAMLIDCKSLEMQPVPIPSKTFIAVMDTGTRRGLVDSEYNIRRSQCEQASRMLGVEKLRQSDIIKLEMERSKLDDIVYRRAHHVITENQRTLDAAQCMKKGDSYSMGFLMNKSHESLKKDFEVCNEALNVMVECACAQDFCYGARMTGAGFGGCAVALVTSLGVKTFETLVSQEYEKRMKIKPTIHICQATNGAEIVNPDFPTNL